MDVINLLQECLSTVMSGKLPETDLIKLLISKVSCACSERGEEPRGLQLSPWLDRPEP